MKNCYNKKKRKRINSLVLLICFTLILLITATYAWFATQKNISINNLQGRVEVANGLKISLDAENWKQSISFGTTSSSNIGQQVSNGIDSSWDQFDLGIQTSSSAYTYDNSNYVTNNIRPILNTAQFVRGESGADSTTGYLSPISSAGTLTSDNKKIKFFQGSYEGTSLNDIVQAEENENAGIYAFDVYIMNTSSGSDSDQLYLNYDSVVREIKQSITGVDYGLKNSVRVGFAFYENEVGTSNSKGEILQAINDSEISQVAIWEPNYDTHSEYVMRQNENLRTLADNVANGANAITSVYFEDLPAGNKIDDVYNADDTTTGLRKYTPIRTKGQIITAQLNEEDVSANASGIQKIKDVDGNDVKLTANKISKMRIYVWLEGQDPDCIDWAAHSDGIDVNIGLVKAESGKKLTEGSFDLSDEINVSVTGVSLNKETTIIAYEGRETLIATIEPSNASNKNVIWSSSDENVASVDENGVVTANDTSGNAIITVTTVDGGFTASCEIEATTCFAKGTKITMSDGSIKNIEDIKEGENVLTFNHEKGCYESQEVYLAWKSKVPSKAFTLKFNNGINLSIVGEHDLFEKEDLKYVTISKDNAETFIGKHFYSVDDKKYVELISVEKGNKDVDYYSLYTKYNGNCVANGMISLPDDTDHFLNIYEFNEDLTIDKEKLAQDIAKYGIYEFNEKLGLTKEEYDFMNIKYLNIVTGKGLETLETLKSINDDYKKDK